MRVSNSSNKPDWSFKDSERIVYTPLKCNSPKPKAKKKKVKKKKTEWVTAHPKMTQDQFYRSEGWRRLRYRVLKKYDACCMACGRSKKVHGVVLHVDHIHPRSTHPKLELVFENLQVLCEDCNLGKSNKDCIDYRPEEAPFELDLVMSAMERI